MNKYKAIQLLFFDSIQQRLPQNISLVHMIAEILGISYDSAYRRLRGEKDLSIDEMKILSNKYGISIDLLFGVSNAEVLFQPFAIDRSEVSLEQWLGFMILEIMAIKEAATKEAILVTRDLLISHYFNFPELAAFRFYFWKKIILRYPEYRDKHFDINDMPVRLSELGQKMLNLYSKIPTIEIWCQESFTRVMHQIEFCSISGFFESKQDVNMLFEKLETLIRHMQDQSEQGCKFQYGYLAADNEVQNFNVFLNEILLFENTIFVEKDKQKKIISTYNSLDLLVTTNQAFCSQVEHAVRTLMKTGNHISGTSGSESKHFFNALYQKLGEFKTISISNR